MLRICIPVHNEATTIGVLLWRLRSVFQGFSREYDVVVYDDASTDGTGDVLEPYQSVMPLTVLRGSTHRGYAGSIDALVRHVAADDEYARRDAMVLLQGDFTESPEHLPELVKRFEGGADLVAVHRTVSDATPADERRLRRWGRWAVKPFLRLPPVADPFTGYRLVRISVLRDLLKVMGGRPICAGEGWAANIDFALNVTPFARRIENVEFAPRYDVRQRASRRRGWPDVVALFHWARLARGTVRPVPGARPAAETPSRLDRGADSQVIAPPVDRQRSSAAPPERAERPSDRGRRPPRDAAEGPNRGGPPRGETRPLLEERVAREERAPREERPVREERPPREGRNAREERALRGEERSARPERPAREPRPPRPERTPRPERDEYVEAIAESVAPDDIELMPIAAGDDGADAPIDGALPEGDAADAAQPKRARRRRRRSRRDRGARNPDGTPITGPDGATDAVANDLAGTSEDGEGEDSDGGDDAGEIGTEESAAGSPGETVRRKRRSRRRRRGRRPDGPGADGTESAAPPAAEPPAE